MLESLQTNSTISHYRILQKLGAGGMGEVYLAQDTKLDRKVALKILPRHLAADQKRMRRFVQEAKAASALNHPNIITIHEIGQFDSVNFIATEFIDGETLRQRMRQRAMKLSEVLDVAAQMANALSAAHSANIVHRDIKPENIMLRRDGIVKVLDFGLVKLTEQQESVNSEAPTSFKTNPGTVVGTATYMSPEQARGTKLDARTDIFSLGIVVYEMMSGRLPFEGPSSTEVLASILSDKEPPPLARYSVDVPVELERIVAKALRKNREERYQTIKDLLLDLQSLKQELEFQRKLERSVPPHLKSGTETGEKTAQTVTGSSSRSTVAVRRLTSGIKLKQTRVVIAVAALVIIAMGLGTYLFFMRGRGGPISSIAVMPFVNASDNQDTEYLSDGISESLINSLSQLPGVKVIARSSSFQYKGKQVDPQTVANALGVEAIMMGRVAQRGDSLIIGVELVDARDKTHVWGEQYNRKAADILQIQSEISQEIAEKLRLRLTANARQQLAKPETTSPQAYEQLLRARSQRDKGGPENVKKAIEFLKQAIAFDPGYAPAYAELSEYYRNLVAMSVLDPEVGMPQAQEAARKALELDDNLANSHYAWAGLKLDGWDWATAEKEYRRTIELNPNLARAHAGYSRYLSVMGRHEQAIAEIKRTKELDPLSPLANTAFGQRLRWARQYDQAMEELKKTLELDNSFPNVHLYLGHVYMAKGQYVEAIAAYEKAIGLGGETPVAQIYLGAACARAGQRKRAQAILNRLQTTNEYVSPAELAVLHDALGEREQAFASLEKAYAARDLQLQFIGIDSAYDSLRNDPHFKDLLRRVGLPQ